MKFITILAFVALFVGTMADDRDAETLRYDSNVEPLGYEFAVETSDGKYAQEQGKVKNLGTENEAIVVTGSYSYIGDDGVKYQVNYVADENGFQPQGDHIPVV